MINSVECFELYVAVKLHFQGKYDFQKYGGRISNAEGKFEKRKDARYFITLARKMTNRDECREFLVSNLMRKPNLWVGDLCSAKATETHLKRLSVVDGFAYHFAEDLKRLLEVPFDDNFKSTDEFEQPRILRLYHTDKIHLETLLALENVLHFSAKFATIPLFSETYFLIKRYRAFFDPSTKMCREIAKPLMASASLYQTKTAEINIPKKRGTEQAEILKTKTNLLTFLE